MTSIIANSTVALNFGKQLEKEIEGEVLFDNFSRGQYATDASIYQMIPTGVVVPKNSSDIEKVINLGRKDGISLLARGGGTSQSGQTVNNSVVLDNSKFLNKIIEIDVKNRSCVVEPGIVLDELNRILKPHGLWFPVDISTSSRATIGGMAANNSCGGRSIRYGTMRDNVISIEGFMSDGSYCHFGTIENPNTSDLSKALKLIGERDALEIEHRFPKLIRRVGGYNIDALIPKVEPNNLSHLLVGSEGTLVYSSKVELKLSPLITKKVMGVCHFPSFQKAMEATQHLVKLKPLSVELVDATMIKLARGIPLFQKSVEKFVQGNPEALLLIEFSEKDPSQNSIKLEELCDVMGELGYCWENSSTRWGGVIKVVEDNLQNEISEVRSQTQYYDVYERIWETCFIRRRLCGRINRFGRLYCRIDRNI